MPGAGYFLIGHKTRALVVLVTIMLLFLGGMLIGGVRVVDAPNLRGSGSIGYEIAQKPWFIGQVLAGPISLVGAAVSRHFPASHARVFGIGTLYTAVAGMLNLMALIDSAHRAARGDVR